MLIPKSISGRLVTKRGVHLQPSGQHTAWMKRADDWIRLLVEMGMSWVVVLTDSDAFFTSGAAKALLDAGIIPIVRFAYRFPGPWTHNAAVEQLVNLYAKYGAPCIIQFANEPFDSREWRNGEVPDYETAWAIIASRWDEMAHQTVERGAYAGFPDGPCYSENPFMYIQSTYGLWHVEKCVYLGHFYAKGRPLHCPYDDVSSYGTPLTEAEYREALDDFADDPNWHDVPLKVINRARREQADPHRTALDDDVCWRGWEKVDYYANEALGHSVPIAMTEGGWTPRDRAGSGPNCDLRWPLTTPKMVAKHTVDMFNAPSPLFAICPWLLASQDMGASGWPDDCWVGYAYEDKYGREKPVVKALKNKQELALVELLREAQALARELEI